MIILKSWLVRWLVFGSIAVFSAASLKFLPAPWVWIFFAWMFICFLMARTSRNSWVQATFVMVGVALATLGAYESYLWQTHPVEGKHYFSGNFNIPDDILGYRSASGIISAKHIRGNEVIYDATYTIGQDGLRIAPATAGQESEMQGCALFFGGSFTFGEGVRDDEALPYRVGILSRGKYQIHNFGFPGYGPHQMLSSLEHGLVQQAVTCRPSHAIYQSMVDHVRRAAGISASGRHGPRYVMRENGEVVQVGHFDDKKDTLIDRYNSWRDIKLLSQPMWQLSKSYIVKGMIRNLWAPIRPVNDQDILLYQGIVKRSKQSLERSFPNIEFHMLLWEDPVHRVPGLYNKILKALESDKIQVHEVGQILPDYANSKPQYELSPYDPHPNALAYNLLGEYLVSNVLGRSGKSHIVTEGKERTVTKKTKKRRRRL